MKTITKLVFASAIALSAAAPAFAAEEDTLIERNTPVYASAQAPQQAVTKHVRAERALDARAYAPATWTVGEDFGIGSQS